MSRTSLLALVFLLSCRAPAPEFPAAVELSLEFTGDPLRVTTLDGGIVVEVLAEGAGERATEGKLVLFDHAAYRADTQAVIPTYKQRTRVGDEAGNPISAALQLAIAGQAAGFRARVFLPAAFVDASKPARAPAVGDVWLTLEVEQVRDNPQLVELDAFAGEPIATQVLQDGIEIHEYAPGQGPVAGHRDRIEFVILSGTMDGKEFLRNPEEYAYTASKGDEFWNHALVGARAGMLRKYVIPRGYKHKADSDGASSEMAFYFQVTWIEPE